MIKLNIINSNNNKFRYKIIKKYFSTYTKNGKNIEYELKTGITTRKNLIKKRINMVLITKIFELNNDKEFVLSKYVGGKKDSLLDYGGKCI